uniref:Uncharacterized protein n=1 Tax=Xiphophorus maculatus TaxID=8083 RepID=A0A3B5QN37_XIPMA
MQSLFPWVGIGEIRDHVEINRYGLLRLINITYQLANGTMEELTELRNMVMQNRVVLDFLTAPQGGVCKIIGETNWYKKEIQGTCNYCYRITGKIKKRSYLHFYFC